MEIETTPVYFANEVLCLRTYGWQDVALTWFASATGSRVKGSLCTPNGAGKDSVVIASLALWWVTMHARGRVVITSKDARQIDEQTVPAIYRHRGKFDGWKFIERYVETPTGGKIILFTTDDPGRCEGFHRETDARGRPSTDGPLLLIANEAKSIDAPIFEAFDRCTYDGLLYASSPGHKSGQFYDSQFREDLGFRRLRVGLKDCPHIPEERIDDIRTKYGADSAFAKSTLDGEFMDADTEARFHPEGLKRLLEMSAAQDKLERRDPCKAHIGFLEEGKGLQDPVVFTRVFTRDDSGPFWIIEAPLPGCSYIGFGDPATGEQADGSATRDGCSGGIMRLAYTDPQGIEHPDEPVAFLHGHNFTGVHWDNDIVAESLDILLRYYGDPPINIEANNAGVEVIRLLQLSGRTVCRRKRRDHKNPGKLTDIVGFQTTAASKMEWVGALAAAIREQTMDVRYAPAASQLSTFILDEKGRGCAQSGCHDDHATGLGLGLLGKHWAKPYVGKVAQFPVTGVGFRGNEQRVGGAWS